jgi:cysteine desulfurase
VLLAMGETAENARAGVRLSLGPDTDAAAIDHAIAAARRVLAPLLQEAARTPALQS